MKRLPVQILASGMMTAILLCPYAQAKEVAVLIEKPAMPDQIWEKPTPNVTERMVELAANDQIKLIDLCMANYKKTVRDYQGTLHKQERINGNLKKPQSIDIWFKDAPFSVVMEWKKIQAL